MTVPVPAPGTGTALLKAIDEAVCDPAGLPGEMSDFECIVLYGVAELPDREYPPPGHGYPQHVIVTPPLETAA